MRPQLDAGAARRITSASAPQLGALHWWVMGRSTQKAAPFSIRLRAEDDRFVRKEARRSPKSSNAEICWEPVVLNDSDHLLCQAG